MEGVEMEEVKIANWESSIPSDVCTDREIFGEMFSLDTFNNVLGQGDREKLVELLPKEVRSDAVLATQTLRDLFDGSLTSFAQNPLDSFFEKLKSGQYDPVVVDFKRNIKKEWKKESIRKLKDYHTKLLQDIVVSRQRCLSALRGESECTAMKGKPTRTRNSKTKKPAGVLQEASSELNSCSGGNDRGKAHQPSIITFEKIADNTPTTNAGKKRKIKERSGEGDSGKPPAKKKAPAKSKSKGASKGKGTLNEGSGISSDQQEVASSNNAKIEMVSPSFSDTKVVLGGTIPPYRFLPQPSSDSILNAALTGETRRPSIGDSLTLSPSKSSPILASHLQASPQITVKMDDSLGLFSNDSEPDGGCITLNYQKSEDKSDILETSDDFAAIQPTIGFGSSMPSSTITGLLGPTKVMLSGRAAPPSAASSGTSGNSHLPSSNRMIQGPASSQHFQDSKGLVTATTTIGNPPTVCESVMSSSTSPVFVLSSKDGQQSGRIMQISGESLKHLSSQNIALINNNQKIILKSGDQQGPFVQKTILPSGNPLQEVIRISNTDLMNAKASGGIHYVTSSGKNLILHPVPGSNQFGIRTLAATPVSTPSQTSTVSCPSADVGVGTQHHLVPTSTQQLKLNDSFSTLHSSSLLENDDLNLSLGSISNFNLGLTGLNTSGLSNISVGSMDGIMEGENLKLEMDAIDKIDDLSVLDGNPFDSIPNLSDELDGLDLDLVDGLCDFDVLLSDEKKYSSFFSLIRDVLMTTRDHRMNLVCLEKTIKKWASSSAAALNPWFTKVSDWNNALLTALNFLAGTYQDVHPEDFVPYIEYKYKTKYYQWIGAGRDSDNNLTSLCHIWMENLERLPSVKKPDGETEDQEEEEDEAEEVLSDDSKNKKNKRPVTPPPPRFITDWTVRTSTPEEKQQFREQERLRFENPHKAFTYNMHGYESVVGPVKGVYSSQVGMANKARGHSLLVDDRPGPFITILALVRDAVARLPNGEGTRSEICEMLRDSAFLAPDAPSVTLNSVVSGALDRLHYERDPCVRYDSHKKSWIYLHRDRTQEQFERLHHNRSYTKCSKSRNNAARKPRKAATKTQPHVVTVTSTISVEKENPDVEKKDGATISTGNVLISQKPQTDNSDVIPSGQINLTSLTLDAEQITEASSKESRLSTADQADSSPSDKVITGNHEIACVSAPFVGQQSPTIAPTASINVSPQATVSQSQNIQNSVTISPGSAALTFQPPIGGGITNSQGQVVLGAQTVLRLANALRLSQVRLPGTASNLRAPPHRILLTRGPGTAQGQGIFLGQTPSGQTVLLSTGPGTSGQTFGTLQTLATPISTGGTTQSHELLTTQIVSKENSESFPSNVTYSIRPMVKKMTVNSPQINATTAGTSTTTVSSMDSSKSTPKVFQLNITSAGVHTSTALTGTISGGNLSSETLTSTSVGTNFQQGTTHAQRPQLAGYTFATVRGGTGPLQKPPIRLGTGIRGPPQTIQLQTLGGSSNSSQMQVVVTSQAVFAQQPTIFTATAGSNDENAQTTTSVAPSAIVSVSSNSTPLSSPIIIRSAQGDIMFPGHIALGKGLGGFQGGVKFIPIPIGNKTVLAKIIPPNNSNLAALGSRIAVTLAPQNQATSSVTAVGMSGNNTITIPISTASLQMSSVTDATGTTSYITTNASVKSSTSPQQTQS